MQPWTAWLALSGAAGLAYEVVWLRRMGLLLGGSAVASAITVGAFMAGLGLGAAWVGRVRSPTSPQRVYGVLEATAACWALAFPVGMAALEATVTHLPALRFAVAGLLLLPPATALGATWPLLSARLTARQAARLYAANTTGAVAGVLLTTFVLLPGLGVRGTELAAASLGLAVAWGGASTPLPQRTGGPPGEDRPLPWKLAGVVGAAGLTSLGLEMVWFRLSALAFGATVQTLGAVLAAFLAAVALGAEVGRRLPGDPGVQLGRALTATGALALLGAMSWGQLPYLSAWAWRMAGPEGMLPLSVCFAVVTMGGAPVASGAAFTLAVRCLGPSPGRAAGPLYAANTLGSIAGAWLGGLWLVPSLDLGGSVVALSAAVGVAATVWTRRPWALALLTGLALLQPRWDARLFAVGVHLRVSDFASASAEAVRAFAEEGWTLLYYDQGATGAVAVGRSDTTGNIWLSVNGKVDASTGDDMPTQVLSGQLPVRIAPHPERVAVVGLASGVTAGAVLAEPGVAELTVVELEPSVVAASHYFDAVNGRPLADPRTTLVVDDARAWPARSPRRFDVIVSEPSNPWISGVSNLFTQEYWELASQRLAPGGVFAQWVQLYGMGPSQVRGLLRTFDHVFDDVWLFETIEGTDLLLVGVPAGHPLPPDLPLAPRAGPDIVRCLAGLGWRNTDDRPRIEWEAPAFLHYETSHANAELLRSCD